MAMNKLVITVIVLSMALLIHHFWIRREPTVDDVMRNVGVLEKPKPRNPEVIKIS